MSAVHEKLFTPDELGARWSVRKETVLGMFHRGELPGIRIGRGTKSLTVRFRPQAVEAWEKKQEKLPVRGLTGRNE